jgi:hypothetical protein
MPYEIRCVCEREELLAWLIKYVGEFKANDIYASVRGEGWELLPYGFDLISGWPKSYGKYIIRIWDNDKAFLARLRWA